MAKEKNVLERRPQMPDDPLPPSKISLRKPPRRSIWRAGIDQQDPPRRPTTRFNSYRHQRSGAKFLAGRVRRNRHFSEHLASQAVPAKALAFSVSELPTHGDFQAVCEKSVGSRERKHFRRIWFALPGANPPHNPPV